MSNTTVTEIPVSIDQQREEKIERLRRLMITKWKFRFFLIGKMPIAWIAGMNLHDLEKSSCRTSMPYKWLSQNPFKSIYFATQAMAAELSTGALAILAIEGIKPGIAMLIVGMEAEYSKKANERVFFTCQEGHKIFEAVERSRITGEGTTVQVLTIGKTASGEEISRFRFTWSFKQRSQ